jgi:ABC-type nitrate/sulfonate/bicarbonate transport system substrate-binding protein
VGCGSQTQVVLDVKTTDALKAPQVFTLAWSEYPSWSAIGVASEVGLVDGAEGKQGSIEKKWNVDIVLKEADYDTCITLYATGKVDAACLTNMDTLAPSAGRQSVAILPTSTSVGADACIVTSQVTDLQSVPTYGLEKSVSQYAFERNLVLQGKNPKDYVFKNMDPAAAAQAVQTKQQNINSIMVWNPFVLQTLRTVSDARVYFDSSSIPEEIIDCVMAGADSLKREGGENFACAVVDIYYSLNKFLVDPATADQTLVSIGAKFSSLTLDDMKQVVDLTGKGKGCRFYKTADEALALLNSDKFRKETMPGVVKFCVEHEIVGTTSFDNVVGFNDDSASLNFSTKFIERVKAGK